MKWYQFTPSDTLFFRGAEPMVSGMDFETSLAFPPSGSVISGAVRAAVLSQQNIPILSYKKGHAVGKTIGPYGEPAPFNIIGPLMRYGREDFVPAPCSWYYDSSDHGRSISIIKSIPLGGEICQQLGLKTSTGEFNWTQHDNEVKSLAGSWITLRGLRENKSRFEAGVSIFIPGRGLSELFTVEPRTGNAIDYNRKVEESKLYSSRHIRLKTGVRLIWGIDRECGLAPEGVLVLGGEQRFGAYELLSQAPAFPAAGTDYLGLSPIIVDSTSSEALVAAGEISYRGGWNIAEQFHKDMIGYYPSGAVFKKNINNCCIPF